MEIPGQHRFRTRKFIPDEQSPRGRLRGDGRGRETAPFPAKVEPVRGRVPVHAIAIQDGIPTDHRPTAGPQRRVPTHRGAVTDICAANEVGVAGHPRHPAHPRRGVGVSPIQVTICRDLLPSPIGLPFAFRFCRSMGSGDPRCGDGGETPLPAGCGSAVLRRLGPGFAGAVRDRESRFGAL